MKGFMRTHLHSLISSTIVLFILVALTGCDWFGGGSGGDFISSTNAPPQFAVGSVQVGLPVNISEDDGAINGTIYPGNTCEMFITLDASNPAGQKTVWMQVKVSGATISHYDWQIVDWQGHGPSGELSHYDQVVDIDSQLGVYKVRSLVNQIRYDCPLNESIVARHSDLVKVTAWTHDGYFTTAFFNLSLVPNNRFFIVGDSVSTRWAWPYFLQRLSFRHTFSQAIGGSGSPAMVYRARGVELAYPIEGVDSVGPETIQFRWHRHIADRTHDASYRSFWAEYAKAVSEPDAIEVFNGEDFLGYAERVLKPLSTSYAENQTRIDCDNHGLADGDRVAFISKDQEWPSDISILDSSSTWNFSSGQLPSSIAERRVYFAVNVTTNSFEIKEFVADEESMDLGGDAGENVLVECGWRYDFKYTGGLLDISWRPRTKYDDLIWLLEVSANDIPGTSATTVTIPNTIALIEQMASNNERYILICPPSGSYSYRGPGSYNWNNYYNTYMPWVKSAYPENHIDTMALLGSMRTLAELSLLSDPSVPELLYIRGDPMDESLWEASSEYFDGASLKWVGPGYVPLQFRTSFADGIHLNALGNQVLAEEIWTILNLKGW